MLNRDPVTKRRELFDSIDEAAKRALSAALSGPIPVAKGQRLRQAGGPAEGFWVVADGWLYSSGTVSDGGRQVYGFHLVGDVVGLQDLGWEVAVCDVTAATKSTILSIDKSSFRDLIREHPVLSGLFLTFGIYDHTRLIEQLRVVGRMPAVKRVAHLLLQVADDQAEPGDPPHANHAEEVVFRLPIDQSLIGDSLGLTNISVSRMMAELQDLGYIERSGKIFTLKKLADMRAFADYTERRRAVPLSWVMRGRGVG